MKKFIIVSFSIILSLCLLGCGEAISELDGGTESASERPEQSTEIIDIVDLGCCVKNITVREMALLGANSVMHTVGDFIMTLNSDKTVYATTDIINIWGTLEYIGDNDAITIFSSCPFMIFSISGGDERDFGSALGGVVSDVLVTSVLERGRVYHFEYQKSGGWSADAPDAAFWENFFSEPDLMLPAGEYTVSLHGGFGLTERVLDSASGLVCELVITVKY